MKCFITGAIGSGKTYAASRLATITSAKVVSLDAIFFDLDSSSHRKKKDEQVRDHVLGQCLAHDNVIFEGWHFGEWLIPMYNQLDLVIIVDTPVEIRADRIQQRFHRRKTGLEHDPFPLGGNEHLQNLLKWTKLFDPEIAIADIAQYTPEECQFVRTDSSLSALDAKLLSGKNEKNGV